MSFAFNEDQKLLAETVDRFILDDYSFEQRRRTIAMDGGFDKKNWERFGALGWLALPIPEEFGGLGGSTVDVAVLLEGFGRGLVVEPYQSTIVLGAETIALAGRVDQKKSLLEKIAEGKKLISFAHTEPRSRFNLQHVELTATKDGESYKLNGEKAVVHNAETADLIIVSARTSGDIRDDDGITLFLVDPKTEGLEFRSLDFGSLLPRDILGWTIGITLFLNARGFSLIPSLRKRIKRAMRVILKVEHGADDLGDATRAPGFAAPRAPQRPSRSPGRSARRASAV